MENWRYPWPPQAVGGISKQFLYFTVSDAGDEVLGLPEELLKAAAEVICLLSREWGREGWGEGGGGGGGGHGGEDGRWEVVQELERVEYKKINQRNRNEHWRTKIYIQKSIKKVLLAGISNRRP